MEIDLSCERDDSKCVKKLVKDWEEKVEEGKEHGNILICWEHDALTKIMDKLGVKHAPSKSYLLMENVNERRRKMENEFGKI